jgi:hypothetical protein
MNLNMDNCWGIISGLINLCHELLEHDGEHSAHSVHSTGHSTVHTAVQSSMCGACCTVVHI